MDTGPTSSRVTGVRPRLNSNTYVPGHGPARTPALPRIELAQAYRVALTLHQRLPVTNEPGYRLIHVGAASHAWIELAAQPDGFAIVGRHSCCNLQLEGDPEVALRHLLVRAEECVDGSKSTPTLRLLDLHTHLGFQLDGGSRESSAVIRGPVAVHVGRHALVAIPSLAIDLPEELPAVLVEMPPSTPYRDVPRAVRTLSLGSGAPLSVENSPKPVGPLGDTPKPPGQAPRWTHVSLYGRPPSLHDLRPLGDHEETSSPSSARLALERHGGGQSVEVADTELDTGVLIGRASKCDRRFARLLDDKVSRTHLLILRDGRETAAYDLASTNGTYLDGKRRRRFTLPDEGATLSIGLGGARMRWHPPGGLGG
jgi:hypothetical protein